MSDWRASLRARKGLGSPLGLSLIEILVAVALLAVLVGLAVPGYQRYTMRGYRVAAIELMLDAARCQEHLRATAFRYDTNQCARLDPHGRYGLSYLPSGTANTLQFEIIAAPVGTQRKDRCGILRLDQSGQRSASGELPASACWAGR